MANASAPFAFLARGRRKQRAQKVDACAASETVEQIFVLFCLFVSLFACSGIIVGEGEGRGGGAVLDGEEKGMVRGSGRKVGMLHASLISVLFMSIAYKSNASCYL